METKKITTYLGRKVKEQYDFAVEGTFKSYYAARNWAEENGYETGSMDAKNPIALMKGSDYLGKWHNFSTSERKSVHGIMISENFRENPVTILIF